MAIFLIIVGLLILIAGLLFGIKSMKPADFVLWAAIIAAIGVLFGAFGKRLQDLASSEKSNKILENTQKTGSSIDQFIDENRLDGTLVFDKNLIDPNAYITITTGMSMQVPFSMINSSSPICVGDDIYPIEWHINDDKPEVTCICYDLNGNWMVDVRKNYWRRNPNVSSKFNYDSKGFEVIDNKGNVALSIDISQKNTIVIQGYFCFRKEDYILVLGQVMSNGQFSRALKDPTAFENIYRRSEVRNLFLYDREHYIGQRNNLK